MEKIKKMYLQDEIIASIKRYIVENSLQTGDPLPSQGQMAQQMNISRTALREALKRLEGSGWVSIRNGKGVYVQAIDPADLLYESGDWHARMRRIIQVIEVRRVLEEAMLEGIVRNASDEELAQARDQLNRLLCKYSAGQPQQDEDSQFHTKLQSLCGNPVLAHTLDSVTKKHQNLWDSVEGANVHMTNTVPMHQRVFEALAARDAKRAIRENNRMLNELIAHLEETVRNHSLPDGTAIRSAR